MFQRLASALLFALVAVPASAQNLIDASDERLLAQFLQDQGFRAKLEVLDDGDPVIRSNSSGTNFSIYFYGCERGTDCQSIQFFVAYDLDDGLALERVNAINSQNRFTKVYLDEDNDPFMELDVNMAFGVTHENLADTLEWWLVSMGELERELDW